MYSRAKEAGLIKGRDLGKPTSTSSSKANRTPTRGRGTSTGTADRISGTPNRSRAVQAPVTPRAQYAGRSTWENARKAPQAATFADEKATMRIGVITSQGLQGRHRYGHQPHKST